MLEEGIKVFVELEAENRKQSHKIGKQKLEVTKLTGERDKLKIEKKQLIDGL